MDIKQFLESSAGIASSLTILVGILSYFVAKIREGIRYAKAIHTEITPNGGGSLRDAIDRMEARIHLNFRMQGVPYAYADGKGIWKYISPDMEDILGYTSIQASGMGWLSCIHSKDREKVKQEWNSCIADSREFHISATIRKAHLEETDVIFHAVPLFNRKGSATEFMIWVTK